MQHSTSKKRNDVILGPTGVFWISAGLAAIGTVGFFVFHGSLAGYALAHIGALGVTGILAWLTGLISRRKGYSFRRSFLIALILPPAVGVLVMLGVFYIGHVGDSIACGGSISLSISILLILGYSVAKSRRIVGV